MEAMEGRGTPNRWLILFVIVLLSFMGCIDSSIVNIALPVMCGKLGASMASIEWVVTSYFMAICATILVFGRLGDILGKVRVFQFGSLLFTASSLACALSPNLPVLIASRILQGVGASAFMANNQGIVTQTFTKADRGKALGFLGTSVALGTMLGPGLGGFLVARFSWHAIFLINLPLGLFAFAAGMRVLVKDSQKEGSLDVPGSMLFALSVILAITCMTMGQSSGFDSPIIIGGLLMAFGLLISFIWWELRSPSPLLDLMLFRNRTFSLGLGCAFVSYVCINASIILLPFFLQNARGLSPDIAGFVMMLSPIVIAILSPASGALTDRIGAELPSTIGLSLMGAGFLLMSFMGILTPLYLVISSLLVLAVGQGLFQPPNNTIIMSAVSREKLGSAGSINALVRNMGLVVGVLVSTFLLYSLMSVRSGKRIIDYPTGNSPLFVGAMQSVYMILMGVGFLGALLTWERYRRTRLTVSVK